MKKNYLILLGLTIPLYINAQQAIPASGGNATGGGGSASYTVGQIVFASTSGTGGIITQGVQQPYEIFIETGIEAAKSISLECSVFPNPTSEFINLKIEGYKVENLSFQIYDMNGKLLQNKMVEGIITRISMKNFIPATYFLRLIDNNKEIKTFKIIKK